MSSDWSFVQFVCQYRIFNLQHWSKILYCKEYMSKIELFEMLIQILFLKSNNKKMLCLFPSFHVCLHSCVTTVVSNWASWMVLFSLLPPMATYRKLKCCVFYNVFIDAPIEYAAQFYDNGYLALPKTIFPRRWDRVSQVGKEATFFKLYQFPSLKLSLL